MSRLALSRREAETIQIRTLDGTLILVSVVRIDREKVRLLIEAPLDVNIVRSERLPVGPRVPPAPTPYR